MTPYTDPNSAEFERISNKYKAAVAKSKPLLEETYNDRNPNRFSRIAEAAFYSRRRELISIVYRSHLEGGSPETPAFTSLSGYDGLTGGVQEPSTIFALGH
jgi:hypothetical protein